MKDMKEKKLRTMISVKLDPELADRLDRVSHATGISKTRLIADGLRWRLDRVEGRTNDHD